MALKLVSQKWGIGVVVASLLLLMVLATFSFQTLRGFKVQVITSNSMKPALSAGSVLVSRQLPTSQYLKGDIVTFRAPVWGMPLVTHRLYRVYHTDKSGWVAQTKGDANSQVDDWVISLGSLEGRGVFKIPLLGYVLFIFRTALGFLLISLVFLLFFVIPELAHIKAAIVQMLALRKQIS